MRLALHTFIILLIGASLVLAQERVVPESRTQVQLSYAPIVKKTAPAVVNIYTKRKVVDRGSPFFNDPFFQQFFGDRFRMFGMPRERVISSLGSGVIVDEDGTMVTNYHVIKGAQDITAILHDRREFDAEIMLTDEQSDLAVLKLKLENNEKLPYLQLHDSDTLQVGDLVLAIGNPFGVGQTVTSGIISAVARAGVRGNDFSFYIQTDAAINPGNSGGALIDMHGRLVAVPTAIYSRSGGSNGIGFAIPANMVRALLGGERKNGKIIKPWLGASYQPVTRDLAESMNMEAPKGVLIREIFEDGPADDAGLRSGDVIIQFDGKPVDDIQGLRFRTAIAEIDKETTITVLRNGRKKEMDVTLTLPPEDPPRDERTLKGNHPLKGLKVANLNPALGIELNIGAMQEGVVIIAVKGRNLRTGDVIEMVNGEEITSTKQLERIMRKGTTAEAGWRIQLRRGNQTLSLTVVR